MKLDPHINDFAIRSFRNTADEDYIAARMCWRAQLVPQFLWSSLQAMEKYLKCVSVLNRIRAKKGHNLIEILRRCEEKLKFKMRLTESTRKFLVYLYKFGRYRYYEVPFYTQGYEIISLDRAVWEVRRYAQVVDYVARDHNGKRVDMLSHEIARIEAAEKLPRNKFTIIGGQLEAIIAKRDHPSREPLLWQNAFYGCRPRRTVSLAVRWVAAVSPLSLYPEILDEVQKYVYLPKEVVTAYRSAR
jgi:hypothetical protein